MSLYFNVDIDLLSHPKFIRAERRAPSRAVHLWLGLMSYCRRHATDGRVPVDMLPLVGGPCPRWRGPALEALIAEKLVHRVSETELEVHDYLDWNPSRDEIARKSASRTSGSRKPATAPELQDDDELTQHPIATRHSTRSRVDTAPDRELTQHPIATRQRVDAGGDRQHKQSDVEDVDAENAPHSSRGRPRNLRPQTSDLKPQTSCDPPLPSATRDATLFDSSIAEAPPLKKKSRQPNPTSTKLGQSRCPANFAPTADVLAIAASLGFDEELEQRTRASFTDYWLSNGKTKLDWQATYRNWLRREATHLGLKPPKPPTQLQLQAREAGRKAMASVPPHLRKPVRNLDELISKIGVGG